jgi:hypothetical protein
MESELAFETFHDKVEDDPKEMLLGVAANDDMVGAGGGAGVVAPE